MSNYDPFKQAARALQERFPRLKSSHAHELVAASLNYKSNIARKSDDWFEFDPDYPDTYKNLPDDSDVLPDRLNQLNKLPHESMTAEVVFDLVIGALKPPCDICGREHRSFPIEEREGPGTVKWACHRCAEEGEEVAYCFFCGDERIFAVSDLNEHSECPEHRGESSMEEEEAEGWESLSEYYDNHDDD